MGLINIIGKWNLKENKWSKPNKNELGKWFSFGIYNPIINDENNNEINYIIIANGTRLEQHSKDTKTIDEKELRIDYVRKQLEKKNENYKII